MSRRQPESKELNIYLHANIQARDLTSNLNNSLSQNGYYKHTQVASNSNKRNPLQRLLEDYGYDCKTSRVRNDATIELGQTRTAKGNIHSIEDWLNRLFPILNSCFEQINSNSSAEGIKVKTSAVKTNKSPNLAAGIKAHMGWVLEACCNNISQQKIAEFRQALRAGQQDETALAELRSQLATKDGENQALQAKLAEAKATTTTLQSELAEAKAAHNNAQQKLEQLTLIMQFPQIQAALKQAQQQKSESKAPADFDPMAARSERFSEYSGRSAVSADQPSSKVPSQRNNLKDFLPPAFMLIIDLRRYGVWKIQANNILYALTKSHAVQYVDEAKLSIAPKSKDRFKRKADLYNVSLAQILNRVNCTIPTFTDSQYMLLDQLALLALYEVLKVEHFTDKAVFDAQILPLLKKAAGIASSEQVSLPSAFFDLFNALEQHSRFVSCTGTHNGYFGSYPEQKHIETISDADTLAAYLIKATRLQKTYADNKSNYYVGCAPSSQQLTALKLHELIPHIEKSVQSLARKRSSLVKKSNSRPRSSKPARGSLAKNSVLRNNKPSPIPEAQGEQPQPGEQHHPQM